VGGNEVYAMMTALSLIQDGDQEQIISDTDGGMSIKFRELMAKHKFQLYHFYIFKIKNK